MKQHVIDVIWRYSQRNIETSASDLEHILLRINFHLRDEYLVFKTILSVNVANTTCKKQNRLGKWQEPHRKEIK